MPYGCRLPLSTFTADSHDRKVTLRPDTERWSPEGKTAGNIYMGMAPLTVAVSLFIYPAYQHIEWPDLAIVGVSAFSTVSGWPAS